MDADCSCTFKIKVSRGYEYDVDCCLKISEFKFSENFRIVIKCNFKSDSREKNKYYLLLFMQSWDWYAISATCSLFFKGWFKFSNIIFSHNDTFIYKNEEDIFYNLYITLAWVSNCLSM